MFNYKVFVAELIGTFALVFVGSAASVYQAGLLEIAFAHGLTLAVFAYVFGHISGTHINPAVTFGLALNGTVKWAEALVYWIAQFAGAVLAAFALNAILDALSPDLFSRTLTTGALNDQFPYHAFAVEALLTFFLVSTVLHAAVEGKAGPFAGWAIGTALAIAILAGGPLTGASLNPARSFGPAAASGAAQDRMLYLIYFAGPLLGAAIAVGVYRLLNLPDIDDDTELEPIPDLAEVPLEEEVEEIVEEPVVRKRSTRKAPGRKTSKES
jgi:MIP family channel proteins